MTAVDLAEVVDRLETTYSAGDSNGVCVADGWGLSVRVFRGALEVDDGLGPVRRRRRYNKATHGLSRVVVLGATGTFTLEALRWLDQLGITLTVLDRDGRSPLMSSMPGRVDDARLRRAQAVSEPAGLAVARLLLTAKLSGHAGNLRRLLDRPDAAADIDTLGAAVEVASSVDEARHLEATAAGIYWREWTGHPAAVTRFTATDARRVPEHWQRFDTRASVLASVNGNRAAERPVNALLNYLYALAEVEATVACHQVGLDPGLGVVHADTRGRASFALDLLEAVRPAVEAHVLALTAGRTFTARDFHELPDGQVRICGPLRADLAATMPLWREAVAPWAEQAAHLFAAAVAGKVVVGRPLTGTNRRAAAAAVRARRAATLATLAPGARQRPQPGRHAAPYSCVNCGGKVTNARHTRCEQCIAADPRQTPELRRSRAQAISSRRQAEAGWSAHHPAGPVDASWWEQVCLPALASSKVSEIMAAAGVSKSTASGWRSGKHVPHPSHWDRLAELAGVDPPPLPATTITLDGDGHTIHEPTAGERSARGKVNR